MHASFIYQNFIKNIFCDFCGKVKKLRCAKNDKLYKTVLTWLKVNRELDMPINSIMLKEKAQQFSPKILNSSELNWSNKWLNRFKGGHNVNCGKICGESKTVFQESVQTWLSNV